MAPSVVESPREETGPPASFSDEFIIQSIDLAKEFSQDAETALAKYKDQWVQVTGAITSPAGRFGLASQLGLNGINDEDGNHNVECRLFGMEFEKIQAASMTQEVTINGKVSGVEQGDVQLVECYLVRLGEDPSIKMSVVELTKSFAEHSEAAAAMYVGKPVTIDGVIHAVDDKDRAVLLSGYKPVSGEAVLARVRIGLVGYNKDDQLSPGDQVVLKALVREFKNNELLLFYGWLMEKP